MKKLIFVLVAIALFQFWHQREPAKTMTEPIAAKHQKVILYATSWCGYCKKMRQLLADNHIQYTELDIETSEAGRKQHEQLGGNGVPVLDIKGTVIHGYDEDGVLNTLKSLQMI